MAFGVDKFLLCVDLIPGAQILACIGIFFYGLIAIFVTGTLCFGTSLLVHAMSIVSKERSVNYQYNTYLSGDESISSLLGVGIGIFIVLAALFYGYLFLKLWSFVSLLIGTNNRNHKTVLTYVIIDGIFMVLTLLTLPFRMCYETVAFDLFCIYLSICTYSVYRHLEKQTNQRTVMNPQCELTTITTASYQQPQVQGYPQILTYQPTQVQGPHEFPQVPEYQKPKL